jgi:hypothetical protein
MFLSISPPRKGFIVAAEADASSTTEALLILERARARERTEAWAECGTLGSQMREINIMQIPFPYLFLCAAPAETLLFSVFPPPSSSAARLLSPTMEIYVVRLHCLARQRVFLRRAILIRLTSDASRVVIHNTRMVLS